MSRIVLVILILSFSVVGQTTADLVLINANIRTLDKQRPRAEALAVVSGLITAVGKSSDISRLVGPKTRVIDAGGKLVLPGFNDSHVHFTGIGNQFSHLDLRESRTAVQIIERIAFFARVLPKGRWMLGGGLDFADLSKLPSLARLDAASPDNPLLIYSADYKTAIANTRALAAGNVLSASGVLRGDEITRVRENVPAGYERNWAEIAETASNYAASLGVTSVQDVHSDDLIDVFRQLASSGRLKTRIYECVGIGNWKRTSAVRLKAASGTAMVRGGCVKGMSDGGDEEVSEFNQSIAEADKAGLQVMIHAIGALPIEHALDAFEATIATNGRHDRRFRVEHAARMSKADTERFVRSGAIASMQPYLFYNGPSSGDDYRCIADAGTSLAFGSDASITDLNPLLGVYSAVNSGGRSLTVEEAVRAYTLGSAYAEFQEKLKGTVEAGKLADLVILSDDIFAIDKGIIAKTQVLMTIVNGVVVFEAQRALL